MTASTAQPEAAIVSPASARLRLQELVGQRKRMREESAAKSAELDRLRGYLQIADQVGAALEQLSKQLFQELLAVIEEKLSIALQEVLEQPIQLRARAEWKRDTVHVEFCIERDGAEEDILRGQGGSVANVLSTGLRLFALTTLDPGEHRRFLVLDEQDCWLRPELVPRLVKIVKQAAGELGFQVLMISHHDQDAFARYADRIYKLTPTREGGVTAMPARVDPNVADAGE
jgi:ABC-type glutathione transport system ATPase component